MSDKTTTKPNKKGTTKITKKSGAKRTPAPSKKPPARKSSRTKTTAAAEDETEDEKNPIPNEPEDKQQDEPESGPSSAPATEAPKSGGDGETLYSHEYVDDHVDEDFHHRGAGRWARGLPGPNASARLAVRGPGVEAWKAANAKEGER